MIVTVFRSRLDPAQAAPYAAMNRAMAALVKDMPGLVSYKSFEAKDGERVTIVEFADEASHNAWRDQPQHRKAMELGKSTFYETYKVQVCELLRESSYARAAQEPIECASPPCFAAEFKNGGGDR